MTWIVGHVERQRAGDASPMPLTVSEMSAPIPTVMPMEFKTATLAQDGA